MAQVLSREEKGRMIAEKHDQVMRVDEASYKVASQSRDLSYDVVRTEKGWTCSCFDHFYRQVRCAQVSHQTVYNWIEKYTALMEKYLDRITPDVSDTWRADELYLKVKGNMKYLYALMDDQTRFWIAQEVADTKNTADITPLFKHGQEIAEKKPKTLITDGAPNFHEAFNIEFRTQRVANRPEHIREIRLAGKVHNNKMERMNGEIRDREKVMRGLESKDSPILAGYQLFHNYIRPHEALNGKTPSEVAGIKIEGDNKWLTLIQNASVKKAK